MPREIIKQFLRFGVVGVVGATVDFGSYNLMTRGLGWNTVHRIWGIDIIAANVVSVLIAIFSNFLFNKYWTFRNSSTSVLRQGGGYFALNFVTFILNQLLTSFFAFRVPLVGAVFGSQRDNAAKAISIGFILFLNFLGSKFIIFRKRKYDNAVSEIPPAQI